ncbi:MFS transporter [Streptomyces sp. DSM 41982]|uniref:MFS transporter n=1 Tax=Streptomyces evansiae TaxID=3075535 RepID=A0ABD5E2H7_9ACTN|nr:MFS transporter [Streptomyces sp. DSM 41982]MDT0415559.1 MFS transporter [Streptomyces sp. DSM 41982]
MPHRPSPLARHLLAAALARTGDETAGPALLLLALGVTGGPARASALFGALLVSAALGGPVLGALLDRARRPGHVLAAALTGYATGLGLLLLGLGRAPYPLLLAFALLTGLLGPALSGGWTSQVPALVPPAALPRAAALDGIGFTAATLLGPALAGLCASLAGAPAAVATALALVLLAAPAALRLPPRREGPRPHHVLAALGAGARAVRTTRSLARATLVSTVSSAGQGVFVSCAPLLGARLLGGAAHGTALLALGAASALAAGAVLARRPTALPPDSLLGASVLVLAAAPLLAAVPAPWALVAAVLLTGAGEGPQLTALLAIRHRDAPPGLRGQVFTTGASLKITAYALGAALAGALAAYSLTAALLTGAILNLLAGAAFRALRPLTAAARP